MQDLGVGRVLQFCQAMVAAAQIANAFELVGQLHEIADLDMAVACEKSDDMALTNSHVGVMVTGQPTKGLIGIMTGSTKY